VTKGGPGTRPEGLLGSAPASVATVAICLCPALDTTPGRACATDVRLSRMPGGDRSTQRVLQFAPLKCGVNTRLSDGAGEIRGEYGRLVPHQRCSTSHRATHPSQKRAMTASVAPKVSTARRGVLTGRRTSDGSSSSAAAPAMSNNGTGRSQDMRTREQLGTPAGSVCYRPK
jgi:hypothetical protein